MSEQYGESYKAAGVDVTAGYESVELMKPFVAKTHIPGVLSGIGGFGGLFAPDFSGMTEPVLVSGTDGVGTKLRVAMLLDKHDTIGIDCVAMCVNDIICAGARPLFFLDYLAVGKNIPAKVAAIVSGVAAGCEQAGCALIGGETAEHPGVMPEEDYDLAGFSVGIVDKPRILDKASVREGDAVIGIASSGLHSNGFSLVRKALGVESGGLERDYPELGKTLGEELLTPTRIYVKPFLKLMEACHIRSASNITGGGFFENIPRALPNGLRARIDTAVLEIPPIFRLIQSAWNIPERDMFGTFNMGIGMCVIVPPDEAGKAVAAIEGAGERAYVIGAVERGEGGVVLK